PTTNLLLFETQFLAPADVRLSNFLGINLQADHLFTLTNSINQPVNIRLTETTVNRVIHSLCHGVPLTRIQDSFRLASLVHNRGNTRLQPTTVIVQVRHVVER